MTNNKLTALFDGERAIALFYDPELADQALEAVLQSSESYKWRGKSYCVRQIPTYTTLADFCHDAGV